MLMTVVLILIFGPLVLVSLREYVLEIVEFFHAHPLHH